MSSLYGIGTNYLGWKVGQDDIPTATEWFVMFYLPIFPVARKRLYVVSLEDHVGGIPGIGDTLTLAGEYRILEDLPIRISEVLWTYFFAYLLMPLVLLAPLLLIVPYFQWIEAQDKLKLHLGHYLAFLLVILIYAILYVGGILAALLHRTRGIGLSENSVEDKFNIDVVDDVD